MRTFLDCVPCFVNQALDAARLVSSDESVHERVLRGVLKAAGQLPFDRSPPHMAREIHRIIREETGSADPYADIKRNSTEIALAHLDAARERALAAPDPFEAAVRFAIAGNVMDFALASTWDGNRIEASLDEALEKTLARSDIEELRQIVETAAIILYIGDNAGEVVFDRLLLERLPAGRVKLAVKGGPVINDATREDADAAGIGELARIVDTGTDSPGVILEDCSQQFRDLFSLADAVIAKGQANYETLCDCGREVFLLTQVKCPVIARDASAEVGDWVCMRGGLPQ
jgi:uncharacterized protein with ATP-grasp and redox domains